MFIYPPIFALNYGLCNSYLWIRITCVKFNVTASPLPCYRHAAGTWPWMFCYILPQHARLELLTAMFWRIMVFWGVTPCHWVIPDVSENCRPFQRTWIQNDSVSKPEAKLASFGVFSGGFCSFRSCYPEWCESCSELVVSDSGPGSMEVVPLMGLRSLRISATSQLSKVG